MLNFETNYDSGVYSDYTDEASRLSAYSNALLNIKNFTKYRGRLYQRDRASELTYSLASNFTLTQIASTIANGVERLTVDWGTNQFNITSTPDIYYALTDN